MIGGRDSLRLTRCSVFLLTVLTVFERVKMKCVCVCRLILGGGVKYFLFF